MSSNFQPYVPVSTKTVNKSFRDTNILNLSNDGKNIIVKIKQISKEPYNKIGIGVLTHSPSMSGKSWYNGIRCRRTDNYRIHPSNMYIIEGSKLVIPYSSIVIPVQFSRYKWHDKSRASRFHKSITYDLYIKAYVVDNEGAHRFRTRCNKIRINVPE